MQRPLRFALKAFTEKLTVTSDAAAVWLLQTLLLILPPRLEDKLAPSK